MDKNVQGTNDYSTISKYSMVKQGYFNDEFISEFVSNSKYSRRAPIIHMGYYARAEIIEAILTQFLKHVGNSHTQIISCGAGYDTTYFRLKKNLQEDFSLTYYEVDFIEVISRKTECIRRSKILSSILGLSNDVNSCTAGIHSQGYHLVGGDLRCQNDIESVLSSAGISWAAPTLLLAECSITYMDESSSTKLIEWASTKFPHATFVTFEQICPDDGFGHVMKHHFESLGSPLLSLNKYPDFDLQIRRYKEHVLNDLWQLSIQQRIFNQISNVSKNWPCARFSHSAVALMRCSLIITGGLNEILQPLRDIWRYDTEESSWKEVRVKGPQVLPRYSHTSAVTSDNKFLILLGGVNTHTTHQPGVCVINLLERKCYEYALPNQDPDRPIMLHNHTSELIEDSRLLVFGGGDNCFSFGTSFNPGIINMEISHLLH
ncbi:tRNA wybutosine-synthesizing protein 4-like isoform X5 [Schistocerca gregaria]|uniref:tRNA wybutosine-synthesizing protein 4-like isoform X5 n=1 Tax=Schistocerca gregaria TaxID=7010 RepID=UPI00211EB097|nr:tRNA wybutosine-synthesizing protein 4-like isoform X5 [Schistocerca gregaria]